MKYIKNNSLLQNNMKKLNNFYRYDMKIFIIVEIYNKF